MKSQSGTKGVKGHSGEHGAVGTKVILKNSLTS